MPADIERLEDQSDRVESKTVRPYYRYRFLWREHLYLGEYRRMMALLLANRKALRVPSILLWHLAVIAKFLVRKSYRRVKRALTKLKQVILPHTGYSVAWKLARLLGREPQPTGVNLLGYMRAEMGLGEAARGLALALQAAGEPFHVISIEQGNPSRHHDTSWSHKETDSASFDITLATIAPDNVRGVIASLPRKLFRNRYTIAYWFWELSEVPDSWRPAFKWVNEIWVATRFVEEAFAAKATVPVYRVPVPVRLPARVPARREEFGLPPDTFLFLNTCDTRSYLERKNPLGALRAFRRAFGPDDVRVTLVIKINNPNYEIDYLAALDAEAMESPNVIIMKKVMTRTEMNALLGLCDCYISLHRAEGFGLGPAEAMSLGKPAILTNWSGNVDYMTPDNSAAINYELVKLKANYGPYTRDQQWAEPDLEHAAYWMRRLVANPDLAEQMGRAAEQTIREMLSPRAIGDRIERRLQEVRAFI